MTARPTTRPRLRREDRREQILDAAANLLVAQGAAGVTMERLAEWAGVSKALPYSHFENSDAVLVALYERVVGELGRRILTALETADPETDRVALLVEVYLDAVRDIGPILGAVTAPGSRPSELADDDQRLGVRFLGDLLTTHFDVVAKQARVAAPILLSAATGAVSAWREGDGSRQDVEAITVAVFRAALS